MGSTGVDAQATRGFSQGVQYDQHRAIYSPDAVELLVSNLGIKGKPAAKVLDLAAGTGKFTDALAAREEQYEIIAVEPVQGMRDVLRSKQLQNVEVLEGQANSIPAQDGSFDAVVIAQAFHWFANLESLREMHRVLQRHSALGMIWNVEHWNSPREYEAATSWEGKIHDLLWSIKSDDDSPRYRDMQWRNTFDEQVKKTPLSLLIADDDQLFSLPLAEEKLEWEIKLSKEGAWDRFSTLSQVAVLEGEERERVRQRFMDAVEEADANESGHLTVHGYTHLVWTTKIPAEGRTSLTDVETPGTR